MYRSIALTAAALALLGGSAGPRPASSSQFGPAAAVIYSAPLPTPLRVLRAFSPPQTRFGPGHLGVDLDARSGQPVASAAAGRVSFAGQVAGRGVVVVAHADGIRTEYEPLRPAVRTGAQVGSGQVIGRIEGTHRGCVVSCLHWGARRGDSYLDPLGLLLALGPVRLLPWTGSPP